METVEPTEQLHSKQSHWDGKPSRARMSLTILSALIFITAGSIASRLLYPEVRILPDVPLELVTLAEAYGSFAGGTDEPCKAWSRLFAPNGTLYAPPHYSPVSGRNATARVCTQLFAGREQPRRPLLDFIRPIGDDWTSNGRTEFKMQYFLRGFSKTGSSFTIPCTSVLHLDEEHMILSAWDFMDASDLPVSNDDGSWVDPSPHPSAPPPPPPVPRMEELLGLFGAG
mmetsp:Transcript_17498/g.52873  ORF Transcript_17498/g.52873 Transcript_17498/m.52873 type:complete len:227 (-) Transcript_17498:429-1109(-)